MRPRSILFVALFALPVSAQVPQVTTSFVSLAMEDPKHPADAAGAVSPGYVVGVTNGGIVVQARSGEVLKKTTLFDFWDVPSLTGFYADTRIVYDAVADRWAVAGLYAEGFGNTALNFAVSANGDPTGDWMRFRVDTPNAGFIDFTRMGMTSDRFVVALNANVGTLIVTFMKSDLYNGAKTFSLAGAGVRDLHPVTFTDGSSSAAYFLHSEATDGSVDVYRLDGNTLTMAGHYTTTPWEIASADARIAPQLGSTETMGVGDTTIQAAVGRGGVLWAVHTIVTSSGGTQHSAIRWWRIPIGGTSAETSTIEDPTGAVFYAYPAIAVNRQQAALISYCVFSAQMHPSAGYSYRSATGVMSAPAISVAGTLVPTERGWGDFTTAVVDPVNDGDFWTAALAATAPAWATWWAKIAPPPPPTRVRAVRH